MDHNSGVTGFTVVEAVAVPEPSSATLLGLCSLAWLHRRKRRESEKAPGESEKAPGALNLSRSAGGCEKLEL